MPRRPGVEFVLGELIGTLQQVKAGARCDEMQVAAHSADRAVAIARDDLRGCFDFECNSAAVAAATVGDIFIAHVTVAPIRNGHCSRSTLPPEMMIPTC